MLADAPELVAECAKRHDAVLLARITERVSPEVILLDGRAGLHDMGGLALHRLAHADILVARANEQARSGLELVLDAIRRMRPAPSGAGDTRFVVYDHLDRIGTTDRKVRERVAASLLNLWLSLSQRYDRLQGKVTPRSLLVLLHKAADAAREKGPRAKWRKLLRPTELHAALEEASQRRVTEQSEDHPVVQRLRALKEKTLFLSRRDVIKAIGALTVGDRFDGRGEDALDELVRIGAVAMRDDKVDAPDIFRYAFGVKRPGGVRREG